MSKTLEELDRLAAGKVMGWTIKVSTEGVKYWDPVWLGVSHWQPTRNIAQAWECWQKILDSVEFCCCSISYPVGEGWEVSLTKMLSDEHKPVIIVGGQGRYENASEAIVRACLAAKGVEL